MTHSQFLDDMDFKCCHMLHFFIHWNALLKVFIGSFFYVYNHIFHALSSIEGHAPKFHVMPLCQHEKGYSNPTMKFHKSHWRKTRITSFSTCKHGIMPNLELIRVEIYHKTCKYSLIVGVNYINLWLTRQICLALIVQTILEKEGKPNSNKGYQYMVHVD